MSRYKSSVLSCLHSACRTLQGLLGKLGAGFDDLMPSGGMTSSQLKVSIPIHGIFLYNTDSFREACLALEIASEVYLALRSLMTATCRAAGPHCAA